MRHVIRSSKAVCAAALFFACAPPSDEPPDAPTESGARSAVETPAVDGAPHGGSFAAGFSGLFEPYEEVRLALAGDRDAEVAEHAERMAVAARTLLEDLSAQAAGVDQEAVAAVAELLPPLEARAEALRGMDDLDEMRTAFAELSALLISYREQLTGARPKVAYCPMVDKQWLQSGDEIANPYGGSDMERCGEIESGR